LKCYITVLHMKSNFAILYLLYCSLWWCIVHVVSWVLTPASTQDFSSKRLFWYFKNEKSKFLCAEIGAVQVIQISSEKLRHEIFGFSSQLMLKEESSYIRPYPFHQKMLYPIFFDVSVKRMYFGQTLLPASRYSPQKCCYQPR